jgi:hypothetical protein
VIEDDLARPPRQHAGASGHVHTGRDFDAPFGPEKHIHARPEFDHAHTVTGLHKIAHLLVEDNTPRDQAGNLFEDNLRPVV